MSILFKSYIPARCWWLMPVILATQETRDQEDQGSKPDWTNSLQDPISKKPITEKGWWSGSKYKI
jgi:hypothetical protein